MNELNDSDLEKLYKAHQAESHDAGLRAVYAAGFAAGAHPQAAQLEPAAQAQAQATELAPEEQAIVETLDSTEPVTPTELSSGGLARWDTLASTTEPAA